MGPVIQANGRLTFEGDLRSAILHYVHSEPASALSLLTVWSHWWNLGAARCRKMGTLPAGYISQRRVPSASSSESLFHFVCAVL